MAFIRYCNKGVESVALASERCHTKDRQKGDFSKQRTLNTWRALWRNFAGGALPQASETIGLNSRYFQQEYRQRCPHAFPFPPCSLLSPPSLILLTSESKPVLRHAGVPTRHGDLETLPFSIYDPKTTFSSSFPDP